MCMSKVTLFGIPNFDITELTALIRSIAVHIPHSTGCTARQQCIIVHAYEY